MNSDQWTILKQRQEWAGGVRNMYNVHISGDQGKFS